MNTPRIQTAFTATRRLAPGYFEKCLVQRTSGSGSSYRNLTPETLEQALLGTSWEPFDHPDVMAGCHAFKAPLPGTFGLVDLSTLPVDSLVFLADPKDTGFVEAEVEGTKGGQVAFTVIILGTEQGEEIVFTFHPGDPIRPSRMQKDGLWDKITVGQALELGFKWAKVRSSTT
jgi:hypothetical protein